MIANALWFVKNISLHRNLNSSLVDDEILCQVTKYRERLKKHTKYSYRKLVTWSSLTCYIITDVRTLEHRSSYP